LGLKTSQGLDKNQAGISTPMNIKAAPGRGALKGGNARKDLKNQAN
jgi:hypothetical protein